MLHRAASIGDRIAAQIEKSTQGIAAHPPARLEDSRKQFRDVKAAIHWLQKAARTPHSWQPAKATATTDLLTRRSALLVLLRPGEFEKIVSVLKILYCLTF